MDPGRVVKANRSNKDTFALRVARSGTKLPVGTAS